MALSPCGYSFSLQNELASQDDIEALPDNRSKVDTLNYLSRELAFVKPAQSLDFANDALRISLALDYKKGEAYAYRNMSNVFVSRESYSVGMKYLQDALTIFENTGDSIGVANCYISLGHTFRKLEDREEELSYNKMAYEVFSKVDRQDRIGVTAHNLGETYFYIGDYEKSEELTRYAIRINDSIQNLAVLSSCYKVMGLLMIQKKSYQEAQDYFNKVLELGEILANDSQKFATVEAMVQLSRVNELMGNKKAKLDLLLEAADFCMQNNLLNSLEPIYIKLIKHFSLEKNQDKVQYYVNGFDEVSDSLTKRDLRDRADLAKNVINVYRLESEKRALQEEARNQEESIRRRNVGLTFAAVLLLVLIIFAIYVTKVNKRLSQQGELIEEQNAHLEQLNNTKDKFFSIVAHDLRAPLNSLRAYSSFLVDHLDHVTKEELQEMGKELLSSTDNTLEMADNLITWARVQMKEFQLKPERLLPSELLAQVTSVYEKVASKKQILLTTFVDTNSSFDGDRGQLIFVIRNIVNNAIKFTNNGGQIKISVFDIDESIRISVSDNGIGMSEKVQNGVFNVKKSGVSLGTAGEKGTGLGLVLCHEFVKLHNGDIAIESKEGEGATFHITMMRNQKFA